MSTDVPPSPRPRPIARFALGAAITCWAVALAGGLVALARYDTTPGPIATPISSTQTPSFTVTLYAHPRCPCTRASIAQFARLAAAAPNRADFSIVFYRPAQSPDTWAHTDTWHAASAIPSVRILTDPDGREAHRAGALTSGHLFVRDAGGRTLYSGGITASRGHAVDNSAADAVLAWLTEGRGPSSRPVYGCSIRGDAP